MTAVAADPSSAGVPRSSFPTGTGPAPAPVPDLHAFLDGGRPPEERPAPRRSRELAAALHDWLLARPGRPARLDESLARRLVTDEVLRAEAERDQNVYLGPLFTRFLSVALPDVVFLPESVGEVEGALAWARATGTPVTVRGAASAAMGGAVPSAAGLTLDLSRLDHIDVDEGADVCIVGAGARQRDIHRRLAARDLALPVYSSNLGGTYAGWFVTGGVGLNAFGGRRAGSIVRAADVVLPDGTLVRFHADGRLDVPGDEPRGGHREVAADAAEPWFRDRGLEPFDLSDLAGSEGVLGVVVQLVLNVGKRPNVGAFLLAFRDARDAFVAAARIEAEAGRSLPRPANLKLVLGGHLEHLRAIWEDEDARDWRRLPSRLSAGEDMPWARIDGPVELRTPSDSLAPAHDGPAAGGPASAGACLYVDFLGIRAGRAFARAIASLPGRPLALPRESVRFAAERFRPQQNKRLGPGLLAAEITVPAAAVSPCLRDVWRLARRAGVELDPEVYFLGDGEALVIAGYLTDHRTAGFYPDLALAPALLDLAIARHGARPYVLGRWQAAFAADAFGTAGLRRLAALKAGLDPDRLVNRGVVLDMGLRGAPGRFVERAYRPGVTTLRRAWSAPGAAGAGRAVRTLMGRLAGPARGRGAAAATTAAAAPAARAIHCVNCGECNTVCPVYHEARLRLPQTLTHQGERHHRGRGPTAAAAVLLDLCMRCGNCQEVCQAGIPHLELYEAMAATRDGEGDRTRHLRALAAIRGSGAYRGDFLAVRPGMYLRRTPVALPGAVRFRVVRAEAASGPAATCLHCGACVPACPTGANREFEADDARLITTDEAGCIGCAACVEVCPANRENGGQTLRVMEAPTAAALAAIAALEAELPL